MFNGQNISTNEYVDNFLIQNGIEYCYKVSAVVYGEEGILSEPSCVIPMDTVIVVGIDDKLIPQVFALHQNYPNPFNPVTTLRYDIPGNAFVNIRIYDLKGRLVNTLVSKEQIAGFKSIQWNATNNIGHPVSAGLYLYTIQAGDYTQTKKMVLLK
jgi:hypothetical protein